MPIRKKYLYFGIAAAVVLLSVIIYTAPFKEIEDPADEKPEQETILWIVDKNGYLYYPSDRGPIKFRRDNYSETGTLTISKVIYQSRQGNIYGLLVLPKFASELLPGVILLPGAGVGKESELKLAEKIAELGAAVLTIDQRGVGETNGIVPSLEDDYASFLKAIEPHQHLMVYDALRAYDLLNSAPFIDSDRIIIAGESLGGRVAVIAAAIERNIKGALVISSSGFDFEEVNETGVNAFLKSIDSDHYIGLIAPNKLVMMHNIHDNIIPLDSVLNSYKIAQEPKQLVLVNDTNCNHGYCESMHNGLVDALDYMIGIRSETIFSIPAK